MRGVLRSSVDFVLLLLLLFPLDRDWGPSTACVGHDLDVGAVAKHLLKDKENRVTFGVTL